MKKYDLLDLGAKLLGLYFALLALQQLVGFIGTIFYFSRDGSLYITLIQSGSVLLIYVVPALVLITKSDWTAHNLYDEEEGNAELKINIGKQAIIEVVFIVISGMVILDAVPSLVQTYFDYAYEERHGPFRETNSYSNYLIRDIVQIGLGLITIYNAKNLAQLIDKWGAKKVENDSGILDQ